MKKALITRDSKKPAELAKQIFKNATAENKEELISFVGLLLHNLASTVVPGYSVGVGTLKDYYELKVNKRRRQEIDSLLDNLRQRIGSVELKQEAVDYLENSIVFRLEEITRKLLVNPGRGFDEVIAEFVANALQNLEVQPETKDLILSSLLSLDGVDLLVLKTMDEHFLSNLHSGEGAKGVTRDSVSTLLKDRGLDESVINRSLQRLQSEFIIQPMKVSAPIITESPTAEELYKGKRPDQYDSSGGYVNTDFGRVFIDFLRLSKGSYAKKSKTH